MADDRESVLARKQSDIQRRTQYAVVSVEQLRAINPLTDEEVVRAQDEVTDDMVEALEQMVNAAKAGRLSGREALALNAVAWAATSF